MSFSPFVHYDPAGLGRGFAGGVVIALSTTALMFFMGEVGGISSILASVYRGTLFSWRGSFLAGLLFAGGILHTISDSAGVFGADPLGVHWGAALCGGFLVGFGTTCGNGCSASMREPPARPFHSFRGLSLSPAPLLHAFSAPAQRAATAWWASRASPRAPSPRCAPLWAPRL